MEKDKNENVVEERLHSNTCSDGQDTNNGDTSTLSCEIVENIPAAIIPTEGSSQCVKPKVRIKPQVPAKPKQSHWKPAAKVQTKEVIEGASNIESFDNKDVADITLIIPEDDDDETYGDSEVPTRKVSRSSLRRSDSYEAAVISEDLYYDDVVCPVQNAGQGHDESVHKSTDDDMTVDDPGLHNSEDYYSELADCGEGSGGESDVEEGLGDDVGGVYSYADVPLGNETAEHPDASSRDAEMKDQNVKKQLPTGLGASFREFFRGKLGVKKVKVRKCSNSSFYVEEDDQSIDSVVHGGVDSDGSDSDVSHDYIYIDDLNEPEVSSDEKPLVEDVPPVLKPRGATNDRCQSKQEITQPMRPLPRIPRKNRHPLVKPTVQRSQSDSVPVLPPRKKRDASRKAALDMKIFVQRRNKPSLSDDDHEYIIPEGVTASARDDESKELSVDDENYLVPQNPPSGEGAVRDAEDYVTPENLESCEGEYDNQDYLLPASIDDGKELNKSQRDGDDDTYLVPVSVTVDDEQPNIQTCHLTDSESDDGDQYVAPGSQCLQFPTQQEADETLDSQHSSISHDPSSSRVSSEISTDVSSETGGCYSPGSRMSLSHNDLALSRSLHPTDATLRRQSFPGSATYGDCSLSPSDVCGGAYVPMSHDAPSALRYVDSFGHDSESSSFSEAHSDVSDYEAVRVLSSAIEVSSY